MLKINLTDPAQMQAFIEQEEHMIRDMVDKVIDSGANVLFCQKGIDDLAQHFLAREGILAVKRVRKSDIERFRKLQVQELQPISKTSNQKTLE